jgi:pimeloyl-ACP methyl ester carboxylesterase
MVNGVKIHYELNGSGPDLVLIHGLSGSLAFWQLRIAPELSQNFRVLTYDLRGHGQSDMPPVGYTSRDMAEDLLALINHLGIERPHIVGHSLGGLVAMHLVSLHSDRAASLTVSDSRIRALQPRQKLREWTHWPLWKAQLEKRGLVVDEESEMDFLLLDRLLGPQRRATQWSNFLANTTAKDDLRDPAGLTEELIRGVRAPVYAIYGEYSFCQPTLAGLQRLLPNLRVSVIPKVGHFFPLTHPDVFLSHLEEFYDSLRPHEPKERRAPRVSKTGPKHKPTP